MPFALFGDETATMTTNAQIARFTDIGGLSSKYAADKTRTPDGPTPSRGSSTNGRTWNGNIWGNGSLGTGFGPPKRDRSRGEDTSRSGVGADDSKTGSGSLLATSEMDSWSNSRSAWADAKPNKTARAQVRQAPEVLSMGEIHDGPIHRSKSFVDAFPAGASYTSRQQSAAISRDNIGRRTTEYTFNPSEAQSMSTVGSGNLTESSRGLGSRPSNSSRGQRAEDPYNLWASTSHGTPTDEYRTHPGPDYFVAPSINTSLSGSLPPSRHGVESASRYAETDTLSRYAPSQTLSSTRAIQSDQMPSFSSQATALPRLQVHDASDGDMFSSFENLNIENSDHSVAPFKRGPASTSNFTQMYQRGSHDNGYARQALGTLSQNVLRSDDGVNGSALQASDAVTHNRFANPFDKHSAIRAVGLRYGGPSEDREYVRSLNYPHYTALPAFEHSFLDHSDDQRAQALATGRELSHEHRLRRARQPQPGYFHHPYQPIMTAPFADPYGARYGYGLPAGYQMNGFAPHFPMYAMAGMVQAPLRSPREPESGQSLRSALLEEFKSNTKTSKRYELRDIYDHMVEFSGDQHGSRFIQQKLETANSDEKERVFHEIQTNAMQLMTDVFGNYVIQKFFEHGDQNQKKILANRMRGQVLSLSLQMYGCRVVQKALEHVLTDQQAALVRELENNVIKCVKDQNGNHVVQKAIERVPAEHIQFIINSFTGKVGELAIHPYGCRVIQRLLERCQGPAKTSILQELHAVGPSLISDQYGNYVTQHIIEQGGPEDRAKVMSLLKAQLLTFSKHKFASNVVEKGLVSGTEEQRMEIVEKLAQKNERGETELVVLIKDQYGNYVIQKLLDSLNPVNYARFLDMLYPEIAKARRLAYGKQVQSIEKKMHRFDGTNHFHQSAMHSITTDVSCVPTPRPSLSDGQSPRSNSLPSTNSSTADGPVHSLGNSSFNQSPTAILACHGKDVDINI